MAGGGLTAPPRTRSGAEDRGGTQFTKRAPWTVAFGVALLVAATILIVRLLPGQRSAAEERPQCRSPQRRSRSGIPVPLYAIGNVEPHDRARQGRVDGQIVGVHFKEGDEVRQGALLFEIDRAAVRGDAQAGAGQPLEGQGAARSRGRAGEALQGSAREEFHLARRLRAGASTNTEHRGGDACAATKRRSRAPGCSSSTATIRVAGRPATPARSRSSRATW